MIKGCYFCTAKSQVSAMSDVVRDRNAVTGSIRARLVADIFHDRKSSIFCLVQWTERQLDYLSNILSNDEIAALKVRCNCVPCVQLIPD